MKSNFLLLTKINLFASLDMRGNKQNKAKTMSLYAYIGLMLFFMVLGGAALSFLYGYTLSQTGSNYIFSTIYISAVLTMLALTTTMSSVKTTFAGKDYDLLKSMPIKRSTVIASKLTGLYLLELIYSTCFLVPNAIIGVILTKNIIYFLVPLFMTFLVPAVPLAVGALVSLLFAMFSDRFKFANVITIFFYIIFFGLIFYMSFSAGQRSSGTIEETSKVFMWFNPSLYFLYQAFENNMLYLLVFVGINVTLLIVVFVVLALIYDYSHSIIVSNKSDIKYERKELKNKSEFKALFGVEMKRITSSKFAFINSISSGLATIFIAVATVVSVMQLKNNPDIAPYLHNYGYFASLVIMFGGGIGIPACFLISFEGNNLWMIKTYPIDYKKLMKVKLLVSLIFTLPGTIIADTVMVVIMQPSIYSIIMLYLITIAYILLANFLALRINLAFPKFKWKSENEIMKNSASLVASMFIDWGIVLVSSGVIVTLGILNVYLGAILGLAGLVIMAVCFYVAIMKRCTKIIESYEDF